MENKELFGIINEEIDGFDFLGLESSSKEENHKKMIKSKDFQISLVYDIINNINDENIFNKSNSSIKFTERKLSNIDEESSVFNFDLSFIYNYKGFDVNLIIFLNGYCDGKEIDVESVSLKLYTKDGEEIKMPWIKKDKNLFSSLIKNLLSPYLR